MTVDGTNASADVGTATRESGDAGSGPAAGETGDAGTGPTEDGSGDAGTDLATGRTRSSESDRPTLSVVIVARNEADTIAECIESVQRLCEPVDGAEIVLVDSNSTDETVEIASEYPVTILRIPRDELCSAEAGRHAGFRHADGEFVMFVDGDMDLETDWLERAIRAVERHDDVAGVDGWLSPDETENGEVGYLHGVALYEAAALESVGGIDPRIQGLGDVDTGMRLRRAGYRLVRLPVLTATHPTSEGIGERIRRWKQGYYVSNGEVLRTSLDDPRLFAAWLYRFRLHLSIASWLALGAFLAATRRRRALKAWVGVSGAGVSSLVALRGARWTVMKLTLRHWFFVLGLAIGLVRGPRPREFPIEEVEIVAQPEPDEGHTVQHD